MAKTATTRRKKPSTEAQTVVELPPSEIPEPPDPSETVTRETPQAKAGRPSKDGLTFFQRLAHYPQTEWQDGQLVIYAYRIEPFSDRYQGGNRYVFLLKYTSPIDEETILLDHGSGKYHFKLNRGERGQSKTKPIDMCDVEILNPKYPPKVPAGEWVDDPRNKKWAWAAPPGAQTGGPPKEQAAPPPPNMLQTITEVLDVADRLKPETPQPAGDSIKSTVDTLTAVKSLFQAPPAATENKMLDAIVTLMTKQTEAAQAENRELRAEIRSIRDGGKTNGFGNLKELFGEIKEVFGVSNLKELITAGKGTVETVATRSRMGPWQEFAVQMAPYLGQVIAPISGVIAQVVAQKAMQQPAGAPPTHSPAIQQPAQPSQAGTALPFLGAIAPFMMNYVRDMAPPDGVSPEEAGSDFAEWLHTGSAANPQYDQAMMMARTMGPIGIIAQFRATPLWMDKGPAGRLPSLAEMEPLFHRFVAAFLKWEPESDDEPGPDDPAEPDTHPQIVKFDEKYSEGAGY